MDSDVASYRRLAWVREFAGKKEFSTYTFLTLHINLRARVPHTLRHFGQQLYTIHSTAALHHHITFQCFSTYSATLGKES
jgi:hypothetical protein